MVYEEKEFFELESRLMEFLHYSIMGKTILEDWLKKCTKIYDNTNQQICSYLRYADARKSLAGMLQNNLANFENKELNVTCELIMQILKFSDCNDHAQWTCSQEDAWFINKMIKKYNFIYWEVILRESGEDESDVVRKIYTYIQKWENRIEVADTLYEYLANNISDKQEQEKAIQCIRNLEKAGVVNEASVQISNRHEDLYQFVRQSSTPS